MRRADRVGDEIRSAIARILQTDIKDPRLSGLVSVVEVRASRDLSHAHIYISVLGDELKQKEALEALHSAAGFIRRELVQRVRLRIAPELHFILDDSIAHAFRLGQLIDEVRSAEKSTAGGGSAEAGTSANTEVTADTEQTTDKVRNKAAAADKTEDNDV